MVTILFSRQKLKKSSRKIVGQDQDAEIMAKRNAPKRGNHDEEEVITHGKKSKIIDVLSSTKKVFTI